jgi:hypothetical protein
MTGHSEESLRSYAKRILNLFLGTGQGRFWLTLLLAYGVVGPIILWLVLPPEPEGGFWVDFGRDVVGSGPVSFVTIMFLIFVVFPLMDRRRRRKAAQADSDDQ